VGRVSLEFFIDIKSLRSHYGPGADSASSRNEYQEHFLGGKGGRCVRLTNLPPSCAVVVKSGNLPPSCAVVVKSGNLNFLEYSGPLQACNGTSTYLYIRVGRVAQSVKRLTTGWTVWDRMPLRTRFSARPDRPWGPPSLL